MNYDMKCQSFFLLSCPEPLGSLARISVSLSPAALAASAKSDAKFLCQYLRPNVADACEKVQAAQLGGSFVCWQCPGDSSIHLACHKVTPSERGDLNFKRHCQLHCILTAAQLSMSCADTTQNALHSFRLQ